MEQNVEHAVRLRSEPTVLERLRTIVEICAFIVAACWGLYVFFFQEVIKPASEAPRMNAVTTLTHVPLTSANEFITIRIAYENTGRADIDFAGQTINVWGRTALARDRATRTDGASWEIDRTRELTPRALVYSSGVLRDAAIGGKRGYRFFIAPGAKNADEYSFVLPRHRYDVIEVESGTWFLRASAGSAHVSLVRKVRADRSSTIVPGDAKVDAYFLTSETAFPISER